MQRTLQEELKQIAELRDAIDYNAMREPINQLLQLFAFVRELLEYHPESDAESGYRNLLEACGDLLGYIEQSLAMLGVDVIKASDVPIDPAKHSVKSGGRPTRQSIVKKVIKPGFVYKGKTLEKAEVEI